MDLAGREVALDGKHDSVNGTKDNEGPIRTMPEARQDHGNKEILGSFPVAPCAATERYVQIIAEPGAQADVPAAPEILEAIGKERLAKVDHEMEAEQLGAATSDVAVAAKVSVNLPGEGVSSEQNKPEI